MEPGAELVDIVDDLDQIIATVTRREMRAQRLRHRCCAVLVMGSDGRLLVHQRAASKDPRCRTSTMVCAVATQRQPCQFVTVVATAA